VTIKNQKDFFAGLMFIIAGAAFAWGATDFTVGTGAHMGPGYFPLLLGSLLMLIGAAVTFKGMTANDPDGEKIGKWAWRQLICILGANLVFGVLLGGLPRIGIPAMGMIIGIYALVIIASLAGKAFKLGNVLILATVLAAGSYVVFIWVLNLQIQVWPTFITG